MAASTGQEGGWRHTGHDDEGFLVQVDGDGVQADFAGLVPNVLRDLQAARQ